MNDLAFWKISFGLFLFAALWNAAQAGLALSLGESGWLRGMRIAGNALIALGLAALTAALVALWLEAGYPPFSNMEQSLLWMAWGFCAVYFAARARVEFTGMEFAASLGAAGIMALSTLFGHSMRPLMPALRSNWLAFHVFTCMLSYGAFFAAFCMAILWLARRRRETERPLDSAMHQVLGFGFLMLTIGIVSGSVWAQQAWTRYWGWDPIETWALITWLVYGIYLHLRAAGVRSGERRERLAVLSAGFAIGGFAFVMFTYMGVSYLLRGMHSYAR
jgi:ABC-type transport system involved in cytochrome c biogenesis permease subunit